MTDLFTAPSTPAARPPGWRAPDRPREEPCAVCQGVGTHGMGTSWFCRACLPASFYAGRAK
jgi:hypothetical protein